MRVARLHIGPPKTATTTIQQILSDNRPRLLAAGVLCPEIKGAEGALGQVSAVQDFVYRSRLPGPLMNAALARNEATRGQAAQGALADLCQQVQSHVGPSIISYEWLAAFSPELAADFTAVLPVDAVEVVMVGRRASSLLPSLYQELAKRGPVPQPEAFVREACAALSSGVPSEFDFLKSPEIAQRWRDAGAQVHVVDARSGLSSQTVVAVLGLLAPELPWEAVVPESNVSMSLEGLRTWHEHVTASRPKYVGAALMVLSRMLATFPAVTQGPRMRLCPEVAAAVDAYCDGDADGIVLPTGPLLESSTGAVPEFDRVDALRTMARWQRAADAKWWAIAQARRATRGPQPQRSFW